MIDSVSDRADFRAFRSSRQRGSSGPVAVVAVPRLDATRPAVGFALPKRVGSAVARNRARRRLRAICRELVRSNELPAASYLFTVRNDLSMISAPELRQHVLGAIERAGA
ncbi:MAG: ribonuclease P protein component [Actinomycetes bacterium]